MPGINRINPFSLAKRINRPLILDGAIGSLLQQFDIPVDKKAWMTFANKEHPGLILKIHKEYISAGADIITTNTFRTNPAALTDYSETKQLKLLKAAINLAKEAVNGLPVFIAGSNAPAEDCYQRERTISKKELKKNHHKHISLLADNGCDFILNETQSHFDEIEIICKYCSKNSIPYVLSIFLDEKLKLLSGEALDATLEFVRDHSPLAIGLNCVSPDQFNRIEKSFNYNWGFYLNCGSGNPEDEIIKCGVSPDKYLISVKSSIKYHPSFVGACCGSNPSHIKKIKEYLDGKNRS
jgi:methionine synthase I (cobalamin-dependent)